MNNAEDVKIDEILEELATAKKDLIEVKNENMRLQALINGYAKENGRLRELVERKLDSQF